MIRHSDAESAAPAGSPGRCTVTLPFLHYCDLLLGDPIARAILCLLLHGCGCYQQSALQCSLSGTHSLSIVNLSPPLSCPSAVQSDCMISNSRFLVSHPTLCKPFVLCYVALSRHVMSCLVLSCFLQCLHTSLAMP